jgi:hypothetical protein
MNETLRRIVMMFGIIIVGSIFIFFDTSTPLIIGGSVAFGIILIMGLGLLTIEDFKRIPGFIGRSKDRNHTGQKNTKGHQPSSSNKQDAQESKRALPLSGWRERLRHDEGKKSSSAGTDTKKTKPADASRDRKGIRTGLALAMGSVKTRFIRSKDSSHEQKIDELLDSTIHGSVNGNAQDIVVPEDSSEEKDAIPDIFSNDFDDEDFGLLDDIELDDEIRDPDTILPVGAPDDEEPFSTHTDDAAAGMMSIESILAGETASGGEEEISFEYPDTDVPAENEMKFEPAGDFDGIEVDGGILTLDDDLTETPFTGSVEKIQDIDTGNEFSFELSEDANPFGQDGSGDSDEEAFDAFSLDDLDLDDEGSLDDLGLDIVDDEEEEIDSVGLLPDDILPENNTGKDSSHSKAEVLNFGGFGDSSSEEFMSFGGGADDGLLSMLKTDMQKKKSVQDESLVRDMKDSNVKVQELVDGLEDVLKKMGGKSSLQTTDQDKEK